MTLSYGGIPLTVPTAEQQAEIQAWLDSFSEFEFNDVNWPEKALEGMTFAQHDWPPSQPQLGTLYWPFTAMRWGIGHFICSGTQLNSIRLSLPPFDSQSPPKPMPLIMSTATPGSPIPNTIATNLYMLPPRPYNQIVGNPLQLYLLTLVDERYYWWFNDCEILKIVDGTEWGDLYDDLATQLDRDLTFDEIDENYVFPDPSFNSYYQSIPILLDAVAYNVGQRIVRKLDGSILALNNASSLATLNTNIVTINNYGAKILGGSFQRANDFAYSMPGEVRNVTPIWKSDVPTVLSPLYHVETRKLVEQLGLSEVVGFDGYKVFNDTFHGPELTFPTDEGKLATQVAKDYWARLWNAYLDVTLNQTLNIVPDGLHDYAWKYTHEEISTTIRKPSWNWDTDTLLHAYGQGPFSGNSDNEPWQVQPFFAQVSSAVGTAYPWTEVIPATRGTFSTKPMGRFGTDSLNPSYEFNASPSVPGGTIVLMWRGFQNAAAPKQEWLFAAMGSGGGGSPLTVQESDGSPICTGITILAADSNSMAVTCDGGGKATLYAKGTNSVYIVYQEHVLKAIPCIEGVFITPPYDSSTISTMRTMPGLDFTSYLYTLGTNPDSGGDSGTIINCTPPLPPPAGYYCHKKASGNVCNTNPYRETDDNAVTGPYADSSSCMTGCTTPSDAPFYSETPGITWLVVTSTGAGDTGPCTVQLKAVVTYPPPNQGQLVDGYSPGQGTMFPLNLKTSCTITWLVNIDPVCKTIDITANWNGLMIFGKDEDQPLCADEDLHFLGMAGSITFGCDFTVQVIGTSCESLTAYEVTTDGASETVAYLKPDCTTGSMLFINGLLKAVT